MRLCKVCAHTVRAAPHVRTHARAARTWAHFLVLAFLLAIVPRVCLANQYDPKLVISDFPIIGNAGTGYVCVDCNEFTATLAIIGHESDYIQLTNSQYYQLSSSGNAFSSLMSLWDDLGAGNPVTETMGSVVTTVTALYGTDNVLACIATTSQINAANEYYLQVLNGSGGGSGGSGGSGDVNGELNSLGFYVYGLSGSYAPADNRLSQTIKESSPILNADTGKGSEYYGSGTSTITWSSGQLMDLWIDPYTMNVIEERVDYKLGISLDDSFIIMWRDNTNDYVIVSDGELVVTESSTFGSYRLNNQGVNTVKYCLFKNASNSGNYISINDNKYVTYLFNGISSSSGSISAGGYYGSSVYPYWIYQGDMSGSGNVPEPDPKPEPEPEPQPDPPDPIVPDPPDLPDPGDPVQPTPRQPTNGPTVNITITTGPSNATPADYTPWLEAIYNELKSFHSDQIAAMNALFQELENHCVDLQNKMDEVGHYIAENMKDFADQVTTISQAEMDYLSELMQWVVDNLRFESNVNVEPYDDTSLMYWLRRIWSKLGSGDVNTHPTDPVTEFDPWGEWLQRLIDLIMSVIVGNIGNSVSGLEQLLSDLSGVFPFSVPYDLLLFFTAFSAAPAAPSFDVTIPQSEWLGSAQTLHVDLSEFDDVAAMARRMEMIAFAIGVMLNSRKLFAWDMQQFGLE